MRHDVASAAIAQSAIQAFFPITLDTSRADADAGPHSAPPRAYNTALVHASPRAMPKSTDEIKELQRCLTRLVKLDGA
jgi:hypothetical protein